MSASPVEIDTEIAANSEQIHKLQAQIERLTKRNTELEKVHTEQGWTRYYPSVTSSNPHIHRSTHCSSLKWTTQITWATEISGLDEAKAVETYDEGLCSICFPDAPVRLREEYVTRKSQERLAEKAQRDDAKSLKQLAADEIFETAGRWSEKVKTVAAAKALVTKPVETEIEIEWLESGKAAAAWLANSYGRSAEDIAGDVKRHLAVNRERLVDQYTDARVAEAVLVKREAARPGSGATSQKLAQARINKRKKARKDWGL